ncbi:MAG TPA: hypothetical protein VGS97_25270 [Actinocrinis sp.]|uniref:hypothetical protein n=1 Tax=Actinocrinis sp. TaxID=1920516 RepID=UPI002DDD7E81|nr:hypothetical protein [Actinocrinis sp.]HEV2347431.1 hypothetical protein [Actinocrinis sp.]
MSKQSREAKRAKKAKPLVKVPRGRIGRAVFAGTQVAGAVTAVRAIRDARTKDDKLALLLGALNAAVLAVTVLIAVRTMRATDADTTTAPELAEPLTLAAAER